MITIPLYFLLFIYLLFLVVFVIFSLINISHIVNTGSLTWISFLATFIIVALTLLIFYGTWYFLKTVDWQYPMTIWDSEWIHNLFSGGQINNF